MDPPRPPGSTAQPSPVAQHSTSCALFDNQLPTAPDPTQTFRYAPGPAQGVQLGGGTTSIANESSTSHTSPSFANPTSRRFQPLKNSSDRVPASKTTGDKERSAKGGAMGSPSKEQGRTNPQIPIAADDTDNEDESDKIVTARLPRVQSGHPAREGGARSSPPNKGLDLSHLRLGRGFVGSPPSRSSTSSTAPASSKVVPMPKMTTTNTSNASPTDSAQTPRSRSVDPDPHLLNDAQQLVDDAHQRSTDAFTLNSAGRDSVAPPHSRSITNDKKRALSNDSHPRASPVAPTPDRTNTSGSSTTNVATKKTVQAGSVKRRKIDSNRFEEDAKEIFVAVSDMVKELRVRETEISHLRQDLSNRTIEIQRLSDSVSKHKTLAERARTALTESQAAHELLEKTSGDMREAIRKTTAGTVPSIDEFERLRAELDSLKKDVSELDGPLKLEKMEESKLTIMREMQLQLSNRDDVIKLLRSDLEQKTGELVESRNTLTSLEDRRSFLESRMTALTTDLDKARTDALAERNRLVDQLQEMLVSAGEREETQMKRLDEIEQQWKRKVEAAREGEEEARCQVVEWRVRAVEAETDAERLTKQITSLEQTQEEANRTAQTLIADLRTKLEDSRNETEALKRTQLDEKADLNARLRAAERETDRLRSLESELASTKEELQIARNRIDALVESADRDKSAHLHTLESERSKAKDLEEQVKQLESRLAAVSSERDDVQQKLSKLEDVTANFDSGGGDSAPSESARHEIETLKQTVASLRAQRDSIIEKETKARDDISKLVDRNRIVETERDTLRTTISELESSLATSRSSNEDLHAQLAGLVSHFTTAQISQTAISAELDRLRASSTAELERKEQELDAVQEEKERIVREKEELVKTKVREAIETCEERHRIKTLTLQNEVKKTTNQLAERTKQYNKVANELAKSMNKPVLNANIGSSSNPESNGSAALKPTPPEDQPLALTLSSIEAAPVTFQEGTTDLSPTHDSEPQETRIATSTNANTFTTDESHEESTHDDPLQLLPTVSNASTSTSSNSISKGSKKRKRPIVVGTSGDGSVEQDKEEERNESALQEELTGSKSRIRPVITKYTSTKKKR